jgi:PIN domain nuclease of toxin-antitoxin system
VGSAEEVKLLLDTHIWIWSLTSDRKLGRRTSRDLASLRNELWLSPVSIWEALLLAERGRLGFKNSEPSQVLQTAIAEQGYLEAPLTHEVAFESRRVALTTEDPADRFLAATAKVYDLTLVTADERLLALREIKVLPNRP